MKLLFTLLLVHRAMTDAGGVASKRFFFHHLSKKYFYYRGLSEWEKEPGFLTDTCLDGQDTFKKLLQLFE